MKTLIIGDIHGCFDEFQALLDKVGLGTEDRIIALGDLVNRGPKSAQVIRFFMQRKHPNTHSIMGNHEQKHLLAYHRQQRPTASTLFTRWQLSEHYHAAIDYMKDLPTYIELDDTIIVHGYFEPNIPIEAQNDDILIGGNGSEKYLRDTYERPWYEYYDGKKALVVGHRDWSGTMQPFIYKDRVYGIDTRCVYGGSLTGLLLPDLRFYSVPAKRDHFKKFRKRYLIDGD